MQNALSIDVEDWYHDATRPAGAATAEEIAVVGPRVEKNVDALLGLLSQHESRATLFFLADVAREHPQLVRRATEQGHEIACHGLAHRPVRDRAPTELRHDVETARKTVEDVAGVEVLGFRAPYFIQPPDLWALDVLAEAGFQYDSSYMPLRYFPGNVPLLDKDGGAVRLENGLWEFPLPLSRLPSGHILPSAAGGFSLRALPFWITRLYLARFNDEVGKTVLYTHPWEIDPDSPKLPGTPGYVRWFNNVGRRGMRAKITRLLETFRFAPIRDVFREELDG